MRSQGLSAKDVETSYWEEAMNEDSSDDGIPSIPLSIDDKLRIRAVWINSIFVNFYGKAIHYSLLKYKVRTLWRPPRNVNLIDLGHDFFLASFHLEEDFTYIISGGPWFING